MKDPDLVERMKLVGAIASPKNPEEFRSFMQADYDKWRRSSKKTASVWTINNRALRSQRMVQVRTSGAIFQSTTYFD